MSRTGGRDGVQVRTTATAEVWIGEGGEPLTLGDLRRFLAAATDLADYTPILVAWLIDDEGNAVTSRAGSHGQFHAHTIGARATVTLGNALLLDRLDITETAGPETETAGPESGTAGLET